MPGPGSVVVPVVDVEASVRGPVTTTSIEYAQATVARAMAGIGHPVRHPKLRLTAVTRWPGESVVVAQANVEVAGRPVRAQAVGQTGGEAADRLTERLRSRLLRLYRHLDADGTGPPVFRRDEWRHHGPPRTAPALVHRPAQPGRLVRHKSVPLAVEDVDAAAFAMDLGDYDFYLFIEDGSGQDSMVYRAGPTGYRLAQPDPDPHRSWNTAVPLTINPHSAPRLALADAISRLVASGQPLLFFAAPGGAARAAGGAADGTVGRGRILYRRYDGHFGLITPA